MLTIDKIKLIIVYSEEERLTYKQKKYSKILYVLKSGTIYLIWGGQKRGSEQFFLMEGIKMNFEGKITLKLNLDK